MKNNPCIYICITVYNRINYTLKCIDSIKNQTYQNYKIIIYDDNSTDNTAQIISDLCSDIILLRGREELWWTGGINKCVIKAMEIAKLNDFVFTINNDTELSINCLETLLKISIANQNSIVGAVNVFYSDNNKIEPSAFIRKNKYFFKQRHSNINGWGEELNGRNGTVEVDSLSGKGVLIPIEVYSNIGIYNFEKLPHYHADTEFAFRAKNKKYNLLLTYDAKIFSHQESTGIGTIATKTNFITLLKSFRSIKSANHFKSLVNYNRILHDKYFNMYLLINVFSIIAGFWIRKINKFICKSNKYIHAIVKNF